MINGWKEKKRRSWADATVSALQLTCCCCSCSSVWWRDHRSAGIPSYVTVIHRCRRCFSTTQSLNPPWVSKKLILDRRRPWAEPRPYQGKPEVTWARREKDRLKVRLPHTYTHTDHTHTSTLKPLLNPKTVLWICEDRPKWPFFAEKSSLC